jgi:sirohydrochlorin cobaltochelatase
MTPQEIEEAIVLMGHGSRDSEGAEEFLTFAKRLAARLARPIYPGFLELADPPIVVAIDEAIQAGAKRILAVPWLLLGAGHVKNDLPAAIQVARQRYPQITIDYGTPIAVQPEILSILGDRLAAIDLNGGTGSPETALLLVQRGSSDPEANADVYRAARLLWEGRNFAAVEVAFSGITRPTIQEGLQRCLTQGVRRVLVLPYFLYTGILVKRIGTIVAEMAATHPEYEFRVAEYMGQDSRLEALAQRMIEQLKNGKATMSCDLCQYRIPLFGRESFVGMPQVSDHAHGLRGTDGDEHAHTHQHSHTHMAYSIATVSPVTMQQAENHAHNHDSHHDHADWQTPLIPPANAAAAAEQRHSGNALRATATQSAGMQGVRFAQAGGDAIQECVVGAGIMDAQEIREAFSALRGERKIRSDVLPPYILTAMPGHVPTAALRWDWDSSRAREFAAWCTETLQERFNIDWQIDFEDEEEQQGPHYLRMTLGERQEQCDWRYLNQNRWMGAFCTIANRLLNREGLTALSLETGWFDTVVVFCRSSHAEELLHQFPEAE